MQISDRGRTLDTHLMTCIVIIGIAVGIAFILGFLVRGKTAGNLAVQIHSPIGKVAASGTKVKALVGEWGLEQGAEYVNLPCKGGVYVIRNGILTQENRFGIQLIGVTRKLNGREEEPFWDINAFDVL